MTSKLILGTAQIGMNYGINNKSGKISKEEAFNIFTLAHQSGIQYLDTAPVYGDAQKIIGEFHKLNPELRFNIISKIPSGHSIEKIEQLVDDFILEMNISSIEVLHFHSIQDYLNANPKRIRDIIFSLKKSKKVHSFGVSIYENSDIANIINDDNINIVQLPFNLLDNISKRGDIIKLLKFHGKKIHSRSVFLQGLLLMSSAKAPNLVFKQYLNEIEEILGETKYSVEEIALQYCLAQENIDNTLIGVDSLEHLKINLRNSIKNMNFEVLSKINQIDFKSSSFLNPSNWNK